MNFKKTISQTLVLLFLFSPSVYAKEPESVFKQVYNFFFGEEKKREEENKPFVNLFDRRAAVPTPCDDETNLNNYSKFKGHVNVCLDLLLNENSLIRFAEVKQCITSIGERFKDIPTQSCRDTVLTQNEGNIEQVHQALLDGYRNSRITVTSLASTSFQWDNGLPKDDPDYIPYVENYFSLLGEWYNQTRGAVYPHTDGNLVMDKKQADFIEDRILRPFWDKLQSDAPEWAETFGQIPGALKEEETQTKKIFDIFSTLLTVNMKVIENVYASELTQSIYSWADGDTQLGPSPILASVLGDAMAPFYERIRTLTRIYDVACKLNSCDASFYDDNETIWMLKFFDELGQGNFIEEFSFASDDFRATSNFIKAIYDNRVAIRETIAKFNQVFGVTNIAFFEPGEDFPHFLRSFHRVFAEGHDLIANYEATQSTSVDGTLKAGFFHGGNVSQVNVGFGRVNMERHIATVKETNGQLKALSDSFIGKHNQLINQTIGINSSLITLSDIEDRIEIDTTDIYNLKAQIDAVRGFIHDQQEGFAESVKNVIANLGSSSETFVKVGGTLTQNIGADTSNQGSGAFSDIGKVLLSLPSTLVKGDLLNISVSGEYQPNCAIQGTYGNEVAGARTGPRGYSLGFVNGKSRVQSTSKYSSESTFESQSVSVTACAGYSWGGPVGPSASIKACAEASAGSRRDRGTNTSDANSESTRSDASFDLGLALANTPFPTAPAGALLLVEMGDTEGNKWRYKDLKTLSGSNSIIAERGATDATSYFLVVNDCASPSNSGELTVTLEQYRASGASAQDFVDKIAALMPKFEEKVADLTENGVLSQQTLSSLRNELAGSATGGSALGDFSGNIRNLLEAFMDRQIAILDYKSQVSTMERQLEMKKESLNSLIERFDEEGAQKYLKVSQRNWNLANMDLDFVNTAGTNGNLYTLNRVLRILERNLVSYLDFKYDEERKRSIVGDISLLTRLNFGSAFDDIALNITTFMTALLDTLEEDINNRPVTPKIAKGLHIPNPYYVPPVGLPAPDRPFPVMDDFRSKVIWDQIYAWKRGKDGNKMKLSLKYEDLYELGGLACYVEAPIVDSMGFYFVPENEGVINDFNNLYRHDNAKLKLEGLSFIPFENNPRQYNFTNSEWRFMDVATRMAKSPNDALQMLVSEFPPNAQTESGLGTGRSPFGDFQIGDIPAYRYMSATDEVLLGSTSLNEVKELFIGFTFAASNNDFNVNLEWLNFCAPEGSYWTQPFRNKLVH